MIRFIRPLGLGGAALLITAAILFPVFARARENARRSSCQSNLHKISLALLVYRVDYDGHFPPVAGAAKDTVELAESLARRSSYGAPEVPPYGWIVSLEPYVPVGSTELYQCPTEPTPKQTNSRPTSPGYSDYWMNARVSGMDASRIQGVERIILLGDGDGRDQDSTARYSKGSVIVEARSTRSPWTERHLEGTNLAFVDGHVKWMQIDRVVTTRGAQNTFTP